MRFLSLSWRVPVGVSVSVVIALVMACGPNDHEEDDTQFREDVIWCEDAVAHLEDCCGPQFNPGTIECRHFYEKDTGCTSESIQKTDPAFTTAESQCIRDQRCEAIVQSGMCERAMAAGRARQSGFNSNDENGDNPTATSFAGGGSVGLDGGVLCP